MKYAPLSELLRQAKIKTYNQLMYLSGFSWKDSPDTGRSIEASIIFYQDVTKYIIVYRTRVMYD